MSRPSVLIVLGLLVTTAVVHGTNIAGWPAFFDDEGTYLSQAFATYDGNLAPYTYWYDHPPLGWIQLAAIAWLPGLFVETPLVAGRISMLVFSLAATALIYGTARRMELRRGFAAGAALIWALSPLTILESRQVFLDGIAVPWLLGAMLLALSPRRDLGHYMAAGLCLAIAALTKETTVIFAPAVLLALLQGSDRRTRHFALAGFGFAFAVTASGYLLFAALKGELLPGKGHVSLWDGIAFQLADRQGSGFVLDPGSGSYGLLQFWLGHDWMLVVGGVVSAILALAVRRLRPASVAVLAAALLALRPDGYLPFMYVTAALPFAALAVAGVSDEAWGLLRRQLHLPRVVIAASLLAVLLPVGQSWTAHARTVMTEDVNAAHPQAVAWMKEHVSTDAVVVTDNNYFLDLADAGWEPGWGVVWFTKLDLDPDESKRALPRGWRDVDYVMWSRAFAFADDGRLPVVTRLYENSVVVATFGTDSDRVEIRKVIP